MSFGRTLVSAATLAAVVSGCSLITSLDGLTSDDVALTSGEDGGDANGVHEAGSPVKDASGGTKDGALGDDAQAPPDDATAPDDASGAADTAPPIDGQTPDSGTLGYCATLSPSPFFCDDFDESAGFAKWDGTGTTHGSTSISASLSRSAPSAAVASSDALTTSVADVGFHKAFPSLTSTPRIETLTFDVYLEKIDTTHGAVAVVGGIVFKDTSNALHEFQFVVSQPAGKPVVTFPEYWDPGNGSATGYADHATTATISLQTWIHVAIELSLVNSTGTGSTARLYINGTSVALLTPNIITKSGVPQALLGLSYVAAPSDPWIVHYDNATFTTAP